MIWAELRWWQRGWREVRELGKEATGKVTGCGGGSEQEVSGMMLGFLGGAVH